MKEIYITGDTHGDFTRFSSKNFAGAPGSIIIICGDFGGIWDGSKREKYWLDWMEEKRFVFCFVDGNHENMDLLDKFEIVDFCGGKAHKIRDNIYHLMRGEIFEFEGKKFWCFGGARSHDIEGGIFEKDEIEKISRASKLYAYGLGKHFRVNHISWWEKEMPTKEEMEYGWKKLEETNFDVDYIITHDAPADILTFEPDQLNNFFSKVAKKVKFKSWYMGHHHIERRINKFNLIYESIIRIA